MTPAELKLFKEVAKDVLKIQHRFDPEPKLKKTGRGTMRSEGTTVLEKIKANEIKRKIHV